MAAEITIGDASKMFEKFRNCRTALTPQETTMRGSPVHQGPLPGPWAVTDEKP